LLKACGGIWIASGMGDADRETVNPENKVEVPPEDPKIYPEKSMASPKKRKITTIMDFQMKAFGTLHIAHTRPTFRKDDWLFYKKVNERFCQSCH